MNALRHRLYLIIFEAETPAGKAFDVGLLLAIVISVAALMLESVPGVSLRYGSRLRTLEWVLTVVFTLEYGLRLATTSEPRRYATSFFGLVDLLSIAPTYLSLVVSGTHVLTVVRALRLLRIFRVLKLVRFVREAQSLGRALSASGRKITVFLGVVLTLVLILGTFMYFLEGDLGQFTSIPQGMYWAIVTMTTVGYGDVVPQTVAGKMLASVAMILGYGVIAVPTGIVSAELASSAIAARQPSITTRTCPVCVERGHEADARHCKHCGGLLADAATRR